MDSSLYKFITTSRRLRYTYYSSPAQSGKPTLFFCHGFPSTSRDWNAFVPFFKDRGYGIIIPDLLGYGETDKPTDPSLYVSSRMTKDLVEILDAEKVEKVIAVGHDWGARPVSRLATYCPERVLAYAFFAAYYLPPFALSNYEAIKLQAIKLIGYETFGYWPFLASEDGDTVIAAHIDSFISVVYPYDPITWKTRLAPLDALKESLLEGFKTPLPSYLTKEYVESWKEIFLKNGFAAPTCWYKIMLNGMEAEDERLSSILPDRMLPPREAPIFFAAASRDYVCVPIAGYATFESPGFKDHNVTIREYDADHWMVFSKADELCRDLEAWIESEVVKID